MTKIITIEYFGMEGEGETVTKAKQDAGRKIEQAMSSSYSPYLIDLSDEIEGFHPILIWREPRNGWGSTWLRPGYMHHTYLGLHQSFEQAKSEATYAAFQASWTPGWSDDRCQYLADRYLNRSQAEMFLEWVNFQRRYALARTQGKSDLEAHAIAGGLPT
jgi:hypothetical protein